MNKEKKSIPVRYVTRAEMMEGRRCPLRAYERHRKMSSDEALSHDLAPFPKFLPISALIH